MDSETPGPPAQRLRVTFLTRDTVKYVGHLDMARAWERAIRRSGLPLAYSHGFNPQPRIHFAAALPLGYTGDAEVMDLFLSTAMEPEEARRQLAAALPDGIEPLQVESVPLGLPALQAQVVRAQYRVAVETSEADDAFCHRLAQFIARDAAWRERRKGTETTRYDLRPLVLEISYLGSANDHQKLETLMRNEAGAVGRPDELLAELGCGAAARQITRTRLYFAEQGSS